MGDDNKVATKKLTIAFDVKGTLDGPQEKFVLGLLNYLHAQGHEIVVWSNSYGYAIDCVKRLELENVRAESKSDKWNRDEANFYDIAVEDDTRQTWLAAKKIIWVKDIPQAMGGVLKLANKIGLGEDDNE